MTILNHCTLVLHPHYEALREFMISLPTRFEREEGLLIHNGRNQLRIINYQGTDYVIKSFGKPNIVNRWVYGTLRPSKAKRAYCNALLYQKIGVGTPQPIGYMNLRDGLAFGKSFLVTLASPCTHRYEDLFTQSFDYADDVLREIGRITGVLHNHGLAHKDYGRANILFKRLENGHILIDIIDLNRMSFGRLDMKHGCKNFERLPATAHMHKVLAEAYAKERGFDANACYKFMRKYRSVQPGQIEGEF